MSRSPVAQRVRALEQRQSQKAHRILVASSWSEADQIQQLEPQALIIVTGVPRSRGACVP